MEVTVLPLREERTEDFLRYFDTVAFTDNQDWADCYCCFYHHKGSDGQWMAQSGEENRARAIQLIHDGAMKGYLAYDNGQPVGWCNANDKENFARLAADGDVWGGKGGKICSIVCYVIAPDKRRQGIATHLLETVCRDCALAGYDFVEAYPRRGELNNAQHYHGTPGMYAKAGFTVYKSLPTYDIVRKALK